MLTIPAAIDAHAHAIAGLGVYGFVLKFSVVSRKPAAQLYNLTLCVNSLRQLADALIRAVHTSADSYRHLSIYLNDKD